MQLDQNNNYRLLAFFKYIGYTQLKYKIYTHDILKY